MSQMGVVQESYRQALNASGTTMEQNAVYMNSLEAKTTALKAAFDNLVLGDGGLQSFAKILVDTLTKILEFANTMGGKAVIAVMALQTAIVVVNKGIVNYGTMLKAATVLTGNFTKEEAIAAVGTIGFGEALDLVIAKLAEMAVALVTNPIFWIGAAIAAVVVIFDKFHKSLKESADLLEEYKNTITQSTQELQSLETQLKEVNKQIDSLSAKDKLSFVEEQQLEQLKKSSKELEHQIDLKRQQIQLAKDAANEEAKYHAQARQTTVKTPTGVGILLNVREQDALKVYTKGIVELKEKQKELEEQGKQNTKEYERLTNKILEVSQKGNELALSIQADADAMNGADETSKKLKKELNEVAQAWLMVDDASYAFRQNLKNRLAELSEGGHVDLNLRPVINAEELNKAGYEAAEGIATVFTHTFSNAAGDVAINFTPIMVDPNTGEYLGVMEKGEFEQYCQDVVDGVREDDLNLQIGAKFEGKDAINQAEEAAEEIHEIHETLTDDSDRYQEELDEEADSLDDVSNEVDELSKELQNLIQSLGITETEFKGLQAVFNNDDALLNYLNNLAEIRQSLSDTSTIIDNLQTALETASTALEEYNQNGYLTIDTFQSLMGISAQYLTALVNENGQLEINQSTLGNLVTELKKAKIQELQAAEVADILSYAQGNVADMSAMAQQAVANAGTAAYNAGKNAQAGATGFWTLADAISAAKSAADGTKITSDRNIQRIHQSYQKLAKQISEIEVNTTKAGNAASKAGKKGSSAAKQAKDATKELNKELEETKSKYEKVISWISKQYDKEIDKIKKAKDEAVKAEDEKIKAKEKEKDTALDAIEAEIRALEREKNELKAQKEVLDDRKNALKDEEDTIVKGIEKRIKVLEKERDALIKPIEERIKALEKERDAIIDSTQAEIDSINEIKEKRQTYWDDQINALKEANKELKDNLELQEKLDALEKAKNTKVKVYKEGQGFVYDVDQNAVDQAQKALDEYLSQKAYEDELARLEALKNAEIKSYEDRVKELTQYKNDTKKVYDQQIEDLKNYKDNLKENYTEQIDSLKEYKETVQEQYEEQIELLNQDIDALERHMEELDKHKDALEEHKDAVEEQFEAEISALEAHKDEVERAYDAEIQAWEGYKQGFEDMVNAYEEQQNRLLFEQLTGIKDESNNWMTRLDNLAEFVRKYNELQKQLDTDNTDVSNNASMKEGSTPSSSYSSRGNISSSTSRDLQYSPPYITSAKTSGNATGGVNLSKSTIRSKFPTTASRGTPYHAKGVDSVGQDEIAVVGDSPNQEIVIGSRLNGELMSLDKGTGVVNASSSKSLAGMLNQVGKYGASGFGSGGGTLNNNYNNDSLTINGVTIQGSNISSPETFVNGLLNLKAEALQRAYRHR